MTSEQYSAEAKHLSFPAHGASVITYLLLSNNRVISASDDHTINVFSVETGERLHSLEGHEGGVWCLAVHKESDSLISGSTDTTLRVWDLATGICTHIFHGHTSTIRCLELVPLPNPEGKTLIVTGSRDHSLRVWELPPRSEERETTKVYSVRFSIENLNGLELNMCFRIQKAIRFICMKFKNILSL